MFSVRNRITIRIEGPERIRFLNICAFHRIRFLRVEADREALVCRMDPGDFCSLCRMRHKADVSVTVLKKQGPYFWFRKNRGRRAAYIFAAAAFGFLYVLSLFIWDISFEGNVRYTDSCLLRFVEDAGYHPGMIRSGVSCSSLEKAIRSEYDDITWVSARIDGTRLVIQVKENSERIQEETKEDVPSCLYAAKSGVISEMVTRSGVPQVKAGDEVEAGKLLVSGEVPVSNDAGETDHFQYRRSFADIWIRYETYYENRISRIQDVRIYGKTENEYALLLPGMVLALPFSADQEGKEIFSEQKQLCLFDNFYLPVRIEHTFIRTYTVRQERKSDEELLEQAEAGILRLLESMEEKEIRVLENGIAVQVTEEYCLAKGLLVVEERAVYEQPLQ